MCGCVHVLVYVRATMGREGFGIDVGEKSKSSPSRTATGGLAVGVIISGLINPPVHLINPSP